MERKTKVAVGAAAGVTAAAAVAGIVAKRRSGKASRTYVVAPGADGWTVGTNGTGSPSGTYGTKREAVTAGRKLATANAPSELIIHRVDGTIQDRHAYEVDGG